MVAERAAVVVEVAVTTCHPEVVVVDVPFPSAKGSQVYDVAVADLSCY